MTSPIESVSGSSDELIPSEVVFRKVAKVKVEKPVPTTALKITSKKKGKPKLEIYQKLYIGWLNHYLIPHDITITNIEKDLTDGVTLLVLLEILLGSKVGNYQKKPKSDIQKFDNIGMFINILNKNNVKVKGINTPDIASGNIRVVSDLLWALIVEFQMKCSPLTKLATMKLGLLEWIQQYLSEYNDISINNLTTSFQDGYALCALLHRIDPKLVPKFNTINRANKKANLEFALEVGYKNYHIPKLIDAEEMSQFMDERCLTAYLIECAKIALK